MVVGRLGYVDHLIGMVPHHFMDAVVVGREQFVHCIRSRRRRWESRSRGRGHGLGRGSCISALSSHTSAGGTMVCRPLPWALGTGTVNVMVPVAIR